MTLVAPHPCGPQALSSHDGPCAAGVAPPGRSTRPVAWVATLGLALAAFAASPPPASATERPQLSVVMEDARVVLLPWRRDRWAAYPTLRNNGRTPVRLIGAETPVAARAEIFEAATEAPVALYRPREDGVVVPPGGSLSLGPGGRYLALVDPVATLRGGDRFPLTLRFAEGDDMTVIVSVNAVGGAPLGEGPLVAPSGAPRP